MLSTQTQLNAKALASLAIWHDLVKRNDLSALNNIVHPDAVFRSPMAYQGYSPAPAVIMVLQTAVTIFEDFRYHRQFAGDDQHSVVLEFSARFQDKELKGIDIIRFDDDGKIVEFEVMIRPLNALKAFGEEMGKRLGEKLPTYKVKT